MEEKRKKSASSKSSINGHPMGMKSFSSGSSAQTRKASQVSLKQSTTSFTSSANGAAYKSSLPKYPPNFRTGSTSAASITGEGSIGASYRSSGVVEIQGLESATSSSLLHGGILVCIMISSLTAFICSKLKDPCEDSFEITSTTCSIAVALYFSVINISSCLFSFIIYFLHLIGQCDYISWSAKRKVALEIFVTSAMTATIFVALVLLLFTTVAIHDSITLIGSGFSALAIFCYILRVFLLLRETRMLTDRPKENKGDLPTTDVSALNAMKSSLKSYSFENTKNQGSHNSTSSSKSSRNSAPALVVLSFVKPRKSSFGSHNPQNNAHPDKQLFSEELEDDVFVM